MPQTANNERLNELSPLQKAALAIKELRARLDAAEGAAREPIAIIGMACRFPGADGVDAFWDLLSSARDAISEVPRQRWDLKEYFDPNPNAAGKINTRHGGFLDRVDGFDAPFFGVSAHEAERLDPQQRLLLQTAWHALEDAGQAPLALRGTRTGVFVGITQNDYGMMQMAGPASGIEAYTGTGNGFCFAAGRLAYVLGTQGPCFAVDTACSSSLVALHQACQALRGGECDVALVAGVQLNLAPQMQIFLARTQSFSPDGRCRSFDDAANGFVLGEGVGVIVLRRAGDAHARRDPVRALIRASALNHDGPASGLTVPNEAAQEMLFRDALERARLSPEQIDYIEAHGSATELGDPIEIGALRSVFGEREAQRPLLLGAVKSNFGHLSAAAGIAGLIKTVLMLEREQIAPNLHFQRPSTKVQWEGFAVRVPTALEPWPRGERVRRAGVSSFGLSGTNAHVVLEEAPLVEQREIDVDERPAHLLAISARGPVALRALVQAYADLAPEIDLADLCCSANGGRSHFAQRLILRAGTREELQRGLADYLEQRLVPSMVAKGGPGRLAMFFGDGVDVEGVRMLAASEATVAATLASCESALAGTPWATPASATLACQLALAQMWVAWGLAPTAVAGTGTGWLAALCVAGVLQRDEAFRALAGESVLGRAARIPLYSAVDGQRVACPAGERHARAPSAPVGDDPALFLGRQGFASVITVDAGACVWPDLLDRLSTLYLRGFAIDWAGFDAGHGRRRVRLPGYPFEEKSYWFKSSPVTASTASPPAAVVAAPTVAPATVAAEGLADLLNRQLSAAGNAINDIVAMQLAFLKQGAGASPGMPDRATTNADKPAATPDAVLPAPTSASPSTPDRLGDWRLLRLAATDEAGLDVLTRALVADERSDLSGLHGDGPRRRLLAHQGRADAVATLGLSGEPPDAKRVLNATAGKNRSLVFMFPGVGDHYLRMAEGLYRQAPEFRAAVDQCCEYLRPLLGVDLREVMYPPSAVQADAPPKPTAMPDLRAMLGRGAAAPDPNEARLNQTIHGQPGVFVIEYALGRLWQSRGLTPEAMIGYSIGEYTAACLAGVIDVEDALRLIARRAQLIETLPQGVLLAVPLGETTLRPLLGRELSLALQSTPSMSVVGGPEAAIKALEERLKGEALVSRRLPGTHAFHSSMLESLHAPLVELVSRFKLRPPRIPYVSNLSGNWISDAEATDPVAWARHTWQTVRFADGLAQLLKREGRVFLEVGPGQSLGSFVLQHTAAQQLKDKLVLSSLRSRYERHDDESFFLSTAGKLWLAGIPR